MSFVGDFNFFIMKVIFIEVFFLLAKSSTAYQYCDENQHICLYSSGRRVIDSLIGARHRCINNGSILLEIYNQSYQYVIDNALKSWKDGGASLFEGWNLWLNLEWIDGAYKWNSSGRTVTYTDNTFLQNAPYACIHVNNNKASWSPLWGQTLNYPFVCMQNSTSNMAPSMTVIRSTFLNSTTTSLPTNSINQFLIGGLVAASAIIVILIIIFLAWFCVRRTKKLTRTKSNERETRTIPPVTNTPTLPEPHVYLYGVRKNALSFEERKRPNIYVSQSRTEIIKNYKPPKPGEDFDVYETVNTCSNITVKNDFTFSSGDENSQIIDMHV